MVVSDKNHYKVRVRVCRNVGLHFCIPSGLMVYSLKQSASSSSSSEQSNSSSQEVSECIKSHLKCLQCHFIGLYVVATSPHVK